VQASTKLPCVFGIPHHAEKVLDAEGGFDRGLGGESGIVNRSLKRLDTRQQSNREEYSMISSKLMRAEDAGNPAMAVLVKAVAGEVALLLKSELSRLVVPEVRPELLNVKQAAVYLGRSEQSVQHLIFQKDLPVVRIGRRVHLHRSDLDSWIEKNKY
jgi:excisionase family DNA binding protein